MADGEDPGEVVTAGAIEARRGDSRAVLKTLAADSFHACVTDPPYALVSIGKRFGKPGSAGARTPEGKSGAYARASAGFMGQAWDTGETAFDPAFWREVYRVLKPGAHVVAFGGTRSVHRLACAIEDAGFEIRDMIAWLYGSGFPKSHDVAKAIDKSDVIGPRRERALRFTAWMRSTGLTAWPVLGEHDDKAHAAKWREAHGLGPAAPPGQITAAFSDGAKAWEGWGTALKPALEPIVLARKPMGGTVAETVLAHGCGALNVDACRIGHEAGRWPANVAHDGSAEAVGAFPAEAGAFAPVRGTEPSNAIANVYGDRTRVATLHHGDSGSAARFFYSAKADAGDRLGSKHPTVKPVDLMAWLCRLVTPPGGRILDPFAGTGTTGLAALGEGFAATLIEREAAYFADIARRLAWATGDGRLTARERARDFKPEVAAGADLPLFGGGA